MSILAEIRASGGDAELTAAGGVKVSNTGTQLVERAKAEKGTLIAQLKDELFFGSTYFGSKYWVQIDRLFGIAHELCRYAIVSDECMAIKRLCLDIDEQMYGSLDAGIKCLRERAAQLTQLTDAVAVKSGWMLTGHKLRTAIVDELGDKYASAPPIDWAALD